MTLLIHHNWLCIHSILIYVNFLFVATSKENLVGKFEKLLASPHSLSLALYRYNSLQYPASWEFHCQALHSRHRGLMPQLNWSVTYSVFPQPFLASLSLLRARASARLWTCHKFDEVLLSTEFGRSGRGRGEELIV